MALLQQAFGDTAFPSCHDEKEAIARQTQFSLLFSGVLGLKTNLDNFYNPAAQSFLALDSEVYLREEGNIIETETTQTGTALYINVTHKTAMTIAYAYIQALMVINAISFEEHILLLRSLTVPRQGAAHSSRNISYIPYPGDCRSVGKRCNFPHCETVRPLLPVMGFGMKRYEKERVFGVFFHLL